MKVWFPAWARLNWHKAASCCSKFEEFELLFRLAANKRQKLFLKRVWVRTGRTEKSFDIFARTSW